MSKKRISNLALAIVPVLSLIAAGVQADGEDEDLRPNIIFFEVDDLTYKYLTCMGDGIIHKSPNLDTLARSGVIFKNAMVQGAQCIPSRNSLITAKYPHNLGLYSNSQVDKLPKDIWTFPKAMQKEGYYTYWLGKCHIRPYMEKTAGNPVSVKTEAMKNQMGFDKVWQSLGRFAVAKLKHEDAYFDFLKNNSLDQKFLTESQGKKKSTLKEDFYQDGFFTTLGLDFIENYSDEKPFFLWMNYTLPHSPFDVAKKFHAGIDVDEMPGVNKTNFTPPKNLISETVTTTSKVANFLQKGYYANIGFMDRQFGRIKAKLKEKDMLRNTVIVFFSDHGIMMGDHGLQGKGTLYRQITNPAMIISWPEKFKQNLVVEEPVELIDLVKTCFDIAGADMAKYKKIHGHSLLPLLTGEGEFERKYAFAEIEGYAAVTDGRYRLISGKDCSLLFDDGLDPDNLIDISSQNKDIAHALQKELDYWYTSTGMVLRPEKTKKPANDH